MPIFTTLFSPKYKAPQPSRLSRRLSNPKDFVKDVHESALRFLDVRCFCPKTFGVVRHVEWPFIRSRCTCSPRSQKIPRRPDGLSDTAIPH